ncbi:MAG: hypothetical protein AAF936_09365 [Pseudomonadota bacterium]
MSKELAPQSHLQLSLRVMQDHIWRKVAPDITGSDNERLRFIIQFIHDCYRARAALAVGDFYSRMENFHDLSLPTIKTQLSRVCDFDYAVLKADPSDRRVRRVCSTRKAIRAMRDAEKLTLLGIQFLTNRHGGLLCDVEESMMETFFDEIAYDVADVINQERGRRKTNG